jgi:hypothetical protein
LPATSKAWVAKTLCTLMDLSQGRIHRKTIGCKPMEISVLSLALRQKTKENKITTTNSLKFHFDKLLT